MKLTPLTIEIGMTVKLKNGRNKGTVIGLNKWRNVAETKWHNGAIVDLETETLYKA